MVCRWNAGKRGETRFLPCMTIQETWLTPSKTDEVGPRSSINTLEWAVGCSMSPFVIFELLGNGMMFAQNKRHTISSKITTMAAHAPTAIGTV
jgi:hypothetical protein